MLLLLGTFYSGSALWVQDEGFLLCDVCGPLQSPHAFLTMALLTGFQALAGNQVLQLPVGSLQPPAEPASAAQPHPKGGPPRFEEGPSFLRAVGPVVVDVRMHMYCDRHVMLVSRAEHLAYLSEMFRIVYIYVGVAEVQLQACV